MKMKMLSQIMIFQFLLFVEGASGATFTLVNECNFTVWPGITGKPDFNSTGFMLMQNSSRSFQVTDSWDGVIWGRTDCTFNQFGQGSCAIGDCGSGEMECFGRKHTSSVTNISFSLKEVPYPSSYSLGYDVNQTRSREGYNELWMTVETTGGRGSGPCQIIGCLQWWCWKPITTNSWCYGADYTITFCPLPDTLSIIKLGSERNSTKYLMSPDGDLTLGFFVTDYNSYLGIWNSYYDQSTVVWVANPNTPITSTPGAPALSIEPNTGNLIITVEGRTVMNITDVKVGPYTDVSAKLQDTGNFQLINNFDEKVLWQSFDHPINVLLPGMKLGYDKATGLNLTLTSWLTNEIPHSGAFTLSWEPTDEASQRLMIRRRGQPYWTSGNSINQTFPYLNAREFNLTSVYNKEEQYFSYTTDFTNSEYNDMWILTPDGNINITNMFSYPVRTSMFCYGYDSGDGCVKESSLPPCRTKNDKFNKLEGEFASEMTRNDTDENSSLSISDCFSKCWNNCSCVGFESNINDGTGCVLWTGNLSFVVRPDQSSTWKYVISSQHQLSPSTAGNNV